tara:strand:+ start:914 stop:1087 length:174 start_codon:yes stop_codon:yes gene_type:complete
MAKAFRVNAGFDNPDVSRTFLWIQFGVFTGLNFLFLVIFLLYKYNSAFHSLITGRPA